MQIACMTSLPALGYRRLRTGRRSVPGQIYLLTTVTWHRQLYFLDPPLARTVARLLSAPTLWQSSRCLGWVLMPDHWHGLVELGAGADLSTTMQRAKAITARELKLRHRLDCPLWSKGFHDHVLRRDESLEQVARYIIANPLRAGLVKDPVDYPYWDAWFVDGPLDI